MAPRARRRLRRIARHVRPQQAAVETHTAVITRPLEPEQEVSQEKAAQGHFSDARLAEYVSRGFCLLTPEDLGVDMAVHSSLCDRTLAATAAEEAARLAREGAENAAKQLAVGKAVQQPEQESVAIADGRAVSIAHGFAEPGSDLGPDDVAHGAAVVEPHKLADGES